MGVIAKNFAHFARIYIYNPTILKFLDPPLSVGWIWHASIYTKPRPQAIPGLPSFLRVYNIENVGWPGDMATYTHYTELPLVYSLLHTNVATSLFKDGSCLYYPPIQYSWSHKRTLLYISISYCSLSHTVNLEFSL